MKKVWLIRHGESEGNAGLPSETSGSQPLTELGHNQAKRIVSIFTEQPSLIVYSSYMRSRETAHHTIEEFPEVRLEEWPVHEFTYLDIEKYQNTTNHYRAPYVTEYWERSDPHHVDGPGAESFAELLDRVRSFRAELLSRSEPFIAVFTHGYFMKTFLWLNVTGDIVITPRLMYDCYKFNSSFGIANCALIECHIIDNNRIMTGHLDTSHLT